MLVGALARASMDQDAGKVCERTRMSHGGGGVESHRKCLTGRGVTLRLPAMIRMLGDMPPGVLGLEAVDDIEREDY